MSSTICLKIVAKLGYIGDVFAAKLVYIDQRTAAKLGYIGGICELHDDWTTRTNGAYRPYGYCLPRKPGRAAVFRHAGAWNHEVLATEREPEGQAQQISHNFIQNYTNRILKLSAVKILKSIHRLSAIETILASSE
ncbi:MAG: hypothetical protein IJT30_00530 [Muribaculaceae bacterium]|nr:hypothetical protein [Muribaculaceae bacterium]